MNTIPKINAALYRNLQILINQKLTDVDIAVGQYDFFYVISQNEGKSQQELSDHLMIGKSTTAKVLNNLEKKGYVEKRRDEDDGRVFRIYLTDLGRKKVPKVDKIFKEVMDTTIENLSEKEVGELIRMLEIVLENVLKEVE